MRIKDYVDSLNNLPEISRRRILVGSTFSITAFIFIVWLSVRFYGMGGVLATSSKKTANITPIKEVVGAFEQFTKSAGEGFNSIKDSLNSATTTPAEDEKGEIETASFIPSTTDKGEEELVFPD